MPVICLTKRVRTQNVVRVCVLSQSVGRNEEVTVNARKQIICLCMTGFLHLTSLAAASSSAAADSCGDFSAFLVNFESNKNYQLEHTKWPLHIANLSLCDESGQPRTHKESGKPYPKSWCGGDFEKSKFKNGVFLVRPLRQQSQIQEAIKANGDIATVLHSCDPANESVCARYWMKYYFARDARGCWRLEREEQRTE